MFCSKKINVLNSSKLSKEVVVSSVFVASGFFWGWGFVCSLMLQVHFRKHFSSNNNSFGIMGCFWGLARLKPTSRKMIPYWKFSFLNFSSSIIKSLENGNPGSIFWWTYQGVLIFCSKNSSSSFQNHKNNVGWAGMKVVR